jgi:glycine/D-amino acid oxidase-like deaminating enzyme
MALNTALQTASLQTTPLWTEQAPRPPELAGGALPDRVDVAIVGSGYTGLHAALALRKAGATVAVLEQHTLGWGASSRNGGMALTGLKEDMPALFRRYGAEKGRAFWAWALASVDHVAQTIQEEGIDCSFARTGHVTLAAKPGHFRHMVDAVAWYRTELGYEDTWAVSKVDLGDEIGSQEFFGGLVDRNSAGLHPAQYTFGLARAAARRGAHLVEQAEVKGLERQNGGFRVMTAQGTLVAQEVLLATNGYTGNLVPAARRGIFPIGSYIIATAPLPAALQAELSPRRRMFYDSKNFLNYFRLTPDGRMLFGGRHDLSTNLDLLESAQLMRQRMVEVFPPLRDVPVTHTWSGKLGVTFDLMPHIGRVAGVHYAYGYAGHGVSIASLMGAEAGEMLAGARRSSLFAEIGHARYPFTPYDSLYLPLVSAWFRFQDRVS